jgi:hypothetical protein
MMKTPAWQSLSGWAIAAYLELARHYNGVNNGDLHLSAREFAEGRCSRQTASRAIAELIETGFIEVTRNSGFNVKSHQRQARTFRLTVFFCDLSRSPASRAFEKWTPKPSSKKHSSASQVSHLGLTGETNVPSGYRKH